MAMTNNDDDIGAIWWLEKATVHIAYRLGHTSENAQNIAFFTRFVGAESAGLSKLYILSII